MNRTMSYRLSADGGAPTANGSNGAGATLVDPLEPVRISRRLSTRVDTILRWGRGPAVLSLGCAQREYANIAEHPYWVHGQLVRRFPRVLGVELDEAAAQELRARGYEVVQANVETMDLGERFDSIVAGELIEHLSNPWAFLDAAARHLKPGGRLIITTPNPFGLLYVLHGWLRGPAARWNAEHVLWMDVVVARQLLHRHGFRVLATEAATDYSTRPGPRYRLFVRVVRALGRVAPTAVLSRLFANNVVVVAVRADGGGPSGA